MHQTFDRIPGPQEIIDHFGMKPHPEGGYYVRTYRSTVTIPQQVLGNEFNGERPCATAILYLLQQNETSCLHRLHQDETWHFYLGGPLRLLTLSPAGQLSDICLGRNILTGQCLQYTVPGGHWFAAEPLPQSGYSLTGCTVAPGFDFADFELADASQMAAAFPHFFPVLEKFIR